MTQRAQIVRFAARVSSLISFAFIVMMVIGEATMGVLGIPSSWIDVLGLALFPIGILVGLTLAWWREIAGGCVGLASLAAFYLFLTVAHGRVPAGPYFALVAVPAPLFLLAGWWTRVAGRRSGATPDRVLSTDEEALDEALEETFPASDAISISPHRGERGTPSQRRVIG